MSKFSSAPWWLHGEALADRMRAVEACNWKPAYPPSEVSADGGYRVPDEFVEELKRAVGL